MQFVYEVLRSIEDNLDTRIHEAEEQAERQMAVLAYLRRCVAEQFQYQRSVKLSANASEGRTVSRDGGPLKADAKHSHSRHHNSSAEGSTNVGDTVSPDSSSKGVALEDILLRAKLLREGQARAAQAARPGSDGSKLGGHAGRSSASSHASAHGIQLSTSAGAAARAGAAVKPRDVLKASSGAGASSAKRASSAKATAGAGTGTGAMVNKFHRTDKTEAGAGADSKATDKSAPTHSASEENARRARNPERTTAAATATSGSDEPEILITEPVWTRNLGEQLDYLMKPSSRRFWDRNAQAGIHVFDAAYAASVAAIPSAELLESQAACLSSIEGFATLAPSIAYTFVQHQYQQASGIGNDSGHTHKQIGQQQQKQQDQRMLQSSPVDAPANPFKLEEEEAQLRSLCVAASNASHAARSEYAKHWRLRLERTSVASLTRTERTQLLGIWYRLRRTADTYAAARRALRAHFCKKNNMNCNYHSNIDLSGNRYSTGVDAEQGGHGAAAREDPDVAKTKSLLKDLIEDFPSHPPPVVAAEDASYAGTLSHSPQRDSRVTADKAVQGSLNEFQASFAASVSYVAEAAMGGFLLRDVVQQLRNCSEHELECEDTGQGYSREMWKEALKSYKALHCCLQTEGASDAASCMFLEKL